MFNKLTALDVSKNVKLLSLSIGSHADDYNNITEIDLSNNPELENFGCENNAITSLDFSNNPKLGSIAISCNPLNDNINLSKNINIEHIWAFDCGITSVNSGTFDVAKMPKLKRLMIAGNKIEELDLSNNSEIKHLNCNPMEDEGGNNMLKTIYLAEGLTIDSLDEADIPEGVTPTVKSNN